MRWVWVWGWGVEDKQRTLVKITEARCRHVMGAILSAREGQTMNSKTVVGKKSQNGDTLGPVELILWLDQGNQGDRREQDDQGEVSIIIFGLSKSSGFQKYSICWVFQALCLCLCLCRCLCHCLCLCICVLLWFLNSFHHKLSEYVWL